MGDRLVQRWPDLDVEYRFLSTAGDRDPQTPLPEIGAKGLFTEALETELREGGIDAAVHSLKDLPVDPPGGLVLGAVPTREDPRDVLVLREDLVPAPGSPAEPAAVDEVRNVFRPETLAWLPPDTLHWPPLGYRVWPRWLPTKTPVWRPSEALAVLPPGARVGTSSLRRAAQVRAHRTDLCPAPVRGNVGTRLRKLEQGEYEALILAAAGLLRLGLRPPGARLLGPSFPRLWKPMWYSGEEACPPHDPGEMWMSAPGQGALAVQCRTDDAATRERLRPLDDRVTRAEVAAERALLAGLGGGCRTPIAARAFAISYWSWTPSELSPMYGSPLRLWAAVYDAGAGPELQDKNETEVRMMPGSMTPAETADELGERAGLALARRLAEAGADYLLERAREAVD